MKYGDFKVAVFALICLKHVADSQSGLFSNGKGYFNISSADFNLRFNFSSNSSYTFNRTYSSCLSALRRPSTTSYEISVNCDECTKLCLPLSNTGCSEWSSWSNCSVTCGNGTQTRMKLCMGTNCTAKVEFNTTKCNATTVCQEPIVWSEWYPWSNCSVTCGNGTQTRMKLCTGTNCTAKVEFNTTKCNAASECQEPIVWSEWYPWSNCSVTCGNGTQTRMKLCTGTNCTAKVEFNTRKCNATPECQDPIVWSEWYPWSDCSVTCGNGTQTRVKLCTGTNCTVKVEFNTTKCNSTPECQDESTQTSRQEAVTDDAQNVSRSQVIIVAIACFLTGILVAVLVIIFYMKRKKQGCFSHNDKRVQAGSKKQSGPDLQSPTKRAIAKKYESEDKKNENKAVETRYQSLDLDQTGKDQQTHDQCEPKPPFDYHGNKPLSGHQKQTGNEAYQNILVHNGNSANITPSEAKNVYQYVRNGEDNENVSRESKASSLGQYETHATVGDKVREVRGGQYNTDHEYLVLEPVDKDRKVVGGQSDPDHEYFVLEPVDKVREVGGGQSDADHEYFVLEPAANAARKGKN